MGPIPRCTLATTVLVLAVGCKNPPQTLSTAVAPRVHTFAKPIGIIGASGGDCSSAVPPAPPLPTPPAGVARGIVGFQLWRNTFSDCGAGRQDLYRTVWAYDLTPHQNLKGLVVGATMNFSVYIMPAAGSAPGCNAMTGGAGSLVRLQPTFAMPQGVFSTLAIQDPWPSGSAMFTIPAPWQAGTVAPGVTTLATGLGGASFSVDLKDRVIGALNAGHASMVFMLTGSSETQVTNTSPPTNADCRTTYQFSPLTITHY
jgi:hypothetical protein